MIEAVSEWWPFLAAGGLVGGWVWRLSWKLAKTDAKAHEAVNMSAVLTGKLSMLEHDLSQHREHVAAEYVSRDALKEITDAITRLGDRLDNLFLHFIPKNGAS